MVPVVTASLIILPVFRDRSIQRNVTMIQSQAQLLTNQISTTGYLDNPEVNFVNAEMVALGNAYSGRIIVTNSSLTVVKDTYGVDEGKTVLWSYCIRALKGEQGVFIDSDNNIAIVIVPIYAVSIRAEDDEPSDESAVPLQNDDNSRNIVGTLLLTRSIDDIDQEIDFMRSLLILINLIAGIISVALALVNSWLVSSSPDSMSKRIHDIRETGSSRKIRNFFIENQKVMDEFDKYREKAKTMEEARQAFVSNVSHELKTPLASVKVLADSLNQGDAPLEMYQEFMKDITHEIDRETSIINDLLSLVKLDQKRSPLNISEVSLNDMVEELLKRLRPLAEKNHVELLLESFRPVTIDADEVKFSLALMNLVENGIKYNKENGYVHVTINSDKTYAFIRVEDSGIGIPEESISHIFDRFYRVDKSHSREIGGTGLGLSIVHKIIALHGGEIKVSSILGRGTVFDIRVPLKYVSDEGKETL
jgi:signal transduction histidine kinase